MGAERGHIRSPTTLLEAPSGPGAQPGRGWSCPEGWSRPRSTQWGQSQRLGCGALRAAATCTRSRTPRGHRCHRALTSPRATHAVAQSRLQVGQGNNSEDATEPGERCDHNRGLQPPQKSPCVQWDRGSARHTHRRPSLAGCSPLRARTLWLLVDLAPICPPGQQAQAPAKTAGRGEPGKLFAGTTRCGATPESTERVTSRDGSGRRRGDSCCRHSRVLQRKTPKPGQ